MRVVVVRPAAYFSKRKAVEDGRSARCSANTMLTRRCAVIYRMAWVIATRYPHWSNAGIAPRHGSTRCNSYG
jgi:hypothetical protein